MHRLAVSFALVLLLAPDLSGEDERTGQPKKAWEWTLEERLAARVDPVKIVERQNADKARYESARAQAPPGGRETARNYSIDGSLNPELLLPHELLQSLLTGFVPDEERRRRKRESLRPGIAASGFEEELFWARLRSAAGEYVNTYVYPTRQTVASLTDRDQYALCRNAFTALNNARQVFGTERFDRFLYEGVAPGVWVASATNAADPAAELRYVEMGCP